MVSQAIRYLGVKHRSGAAFRFSGNPFEIVLLPLIRNADTGNLVVQDKRKSGSAKMPKQLFPRLGIFCKSGFRDLQ